MTLLLDLAVEKLLKVVNGETKFAGTNDVEAFGLLAYIVARIGRTVIKESLLLAKKDIVEDFFANDCIINELIGLFMGLVEMDASEIFTMVDGKTTDVLLAVLIGEIAEYDA